MPVEDSHCLTTFRRGGELSSDFTDCFEDAAGRRYLMLSARPFPAMEGFHVLNFYPTNPKSIRKSDHPEFRFVCDEVVDLDMITTLSPQEDEG